MHVCDRSLRARSRRHSGFTLLEVAVAMLILLVSITAITTAVTDVQVRSAQSRLRQTVVAAAQVDAVLIAGQPYDALAGGTFVVPDTCAVVGDTAAASCVGVGGRDYRVVWSVVPAGAPSRLVTVTGTAQVGDETVTVTEVGSS